MNKNILFKNWLSLNKHHFKYQPFLIDEGNNHSTYGFKGLHKGLAVNVNEICFDIWFQISDGREDLVFDIDMPVTATKGELFYCSRCKTVNTSVDYYNSIENMFAEHTFKKLLKWVNNLTLEHHYRAIDFGVDDVFFVEFKDKNMSNHKYKDKEVDVGWLVER